MKPKKFNIQKSTFSKSCNKVHTSENYYEIILIGKGECQFEIHNKWINCNTETALFLKPEESVSMRFQLKKYPLELYNVRITEDYLVQLSDEGCDLKKIVSDFPLTKGMIHLDARDTTLIKNITKTILKMSDRKEELGHKLYKKNMISILVILFLRSCVASDHVVLSHNRKNLVMDDIFRYIREHLTEDLSLEVLEQQFYVSRYHLCREFKRLTGQTIHAYILKSRLDLCKKYIEAGKPIKEVYVLGGFGGYNHFFRAFKKEYGMTPKAYYESLKL